MIFFMIISFILLFILFMNNVNKLSAVLISICFSFLYLYGITEILSLFHKVETNSILICWIVFDFILSVVIAFRLYKKRIKFDINIKEKIKKIRITHIIVAVIMTYIFFLSLNTLPYNYDSMTYHIPRIMHWLQNGSINHYATNIVRQISSPIFAEVSGMHIYVLSGNNDISLNTLQTCSYIINTVLVYFIARKIGCNKTFSLASIALALSMPIAVAEALTTQVDNFAALWCLIFVYFILDFIKKDKKLTLDKTSILKLLCLGISLGFGYLTKPTVIFTYALFTLFLYFMCIRRKDKISYVIISTLIVIISTSLIILPNTIRNLKTFNAISDPIVGSKQIINTDKKSYFAVNFIKNLLWNYQTYIINDNNDGIPNLVTSIADKLNVDIDDESISEGGQAYRIAKKLIYHHDYAVNPIIMWILSIAIITYILYFIGSKFKGNKINAYCIISILSYLIFLAIMRFQVWETRYEISFLLLICPTVGLLFNNSFGKLKFKDVFAGIIIVIALISMFDQFKYHSQNAEHNEDINKSYFISNKALYETYLNISNYINTKKYTNLGIEITEDIYEYPLYAMTDMVQRIEHVNVNNNTQIYYDESYIPEAVISNISNEEKRIFNNKQYNRVYDYNGYIIYELKE